MGVAAVGVAGGCRAHTLELGRTMPNWVDRAAA